MNKNLCGYCGNEIPENKATCVKCGEKIIKVGRLLQSTYATEEDVKKAYNFLNKNKNTTAINISDIIISDVFAATTPSEKKMNKYREYYHNHGHIDKPIVLNRQNVLIDGYIRYLILLENNINIVPIKIIDKKSIKIIYGFNQRLV